VREEGSHRQPYSLFVGRVQSLQLDADWSAETNYFASVWRGEESLLRHFHESRVCSHFA
jgi:hypothetical protein